MRNCKICKEDKELTEFPQSGLPHNGKIYYEHRCRKCVNIIRRENGSYTEKQREYQKTDEFRSKRKEYRKLEHVKLSEKEYSDREEVRNKRREQKRLRHKERYHNDPKYKLTVLCRNRVTGFLKVKSLSKKKGLKEYIGCTLEEFKNYLQSKFQGGMTWENHGTWHIDHIIPLSSAKTEEELYKLCHYTNLQPLWAKDNIKKSNKM